MPDNSDAPSPAEDRSPSFAMALIPVVGLIVLLALAYLLFGDEAAAGPNQIALLFCALMATAVGWRLGFTMEEMREAAIESVNTGVTAIFILLAVGSLIGTWAMSGTLMAMVYWGLMILSPDYFYMTTAIICAVVALCIGSSWTVAGTIGIGLMGVAQQIGLNPAITAGAVISGAYFGDKSSPLSDATNLAAAAAAADLYAHIKAAFVTSVPTLVVTLVVLMLLGSPRDFDATEITNAIAQVFDVSFVPFIPLALVLVLALTRWPPFTTIFLGALAGGVLAVFNQPDHVLAFVNEPELPVGLGLLKGVWMAMATGYESASGSEAVDQLLSRGGMESMLTTIWLILTALAFGGVIEKTRVLETLLDPVVQAAKATWQMVAALVVAGLGTNILASDQYIAIVLPGRMFRKVFLQRGLSRVAVSRTVGDSSTVTSALIPWNSCGAYMAATLGVATINYAPYAIFNLLNPLVAIGLAALMPSLFQQSRAGDPPKPDERPVEA
ncbi:Na+/H+ antiporter NhaC [Lutimaribacter marinistellae]|uniref:Na+/H+ antiporter NhaC n=1 Tax=Lutimaribacter marinistellae TaxID=1820329 RepID=A0ABV7TLT8_9RHOB